MKKLGIVVGVNVAAACLLMQGCKAPRVTDNKYGNDVKTVDVRPVAPADDIKVAPTPAPVKKVESVPVVPAAPVAAEPAPVVVAPVAPVPAVAAPKEAAETTIYTVKRGDMLSKIAKRFGIRQKAILACNPGMNPDRLRIGQKIKLPSKHAVVKDSAPAPVAAQAKPAVVAASVKAPKAAKAAKYTGATKEYVVARGDTLGLIALRQGTTVRTIKELNGIAQDVVTVGQKLKVPANAAPAKAAPAAKGKVDAKDAKKDVAPKAAPAAKSEAKKADVKAKAPEAKKPEVKKDEPKKDGAKAATVSVKIESPAVTAPAPEAAVPAPAPAAAPAAQEAPAAAPTPAPAAAPAEKPAASPLEVHTVKDGEDVVSIAISYGVSPSALMDLNDLKSSEVKPGDKLKIPAKSAQ